MKDKKDLLRVDKMQIMATQGKARDGITPGNVLYIVPELAEMIALVRIINNS
jgi:hypothetical protein